MIINLAQRGGDRGKFVGSLVGQVNVGTAGQ